MKARVFAWALFGVACWGVYAFVQRFENPWAMPDTSRVLQSLPALPAGCGEGCQ